MMFVLVIMILLVVLYGVLDSGLDKEEVVLFFFCCLLVVLFFFYVMYLIFFFCLYKCLFEFEVGFNVGEEEEYDLFFGFWLVGIVLLFIILVISFCVDYMVNSIDVVVESGVFNKIFIGLIFILIVGNVVEYVIVCVVVVKNKMDLVMGVVIGFSI